MPPEQDMQDFARSVVSVYKILHDGGIPDQAATGMAMGYWTIILQGVQAAQTNVAKAE